MHTFTVPDIKNNMMYLKFIRKQEAVGIMGGTAHVSNDNTKKKKKKKKSLSGSL
jgi:hypothetical protein